jgi:uncharacterized protein (DUF302 family)
MKQYTIISKTEYWSTNKHKRTVETLLNKKQAKGYEVVSVSFGMNIWPGILLA